MSRLPLLCVMLLFPSLAICQDTKQDDDEIEFIRKRHEAKLLKADCPEEEFAKAAAYLEGGTRTFSSGPSRNPEAAKAHLKSLIYGADFYSKATNAKRFRTCLYHIVEATNAPPMALAAEIPDRTVGYLVTALNSTRDVKKDWGARLVIFFGNIGPRAKGAIPALEVIRDGDDDAFARMALAALKKINSE